MMLTRKRLPRRTFLRGLGTSIALPLLDAMTPDFAAASRSSEAAPCRMAFAYVPNGVIMEDWTPAGEGAAFELPNILEPMAPYREQMLLLSGLTHNNGRALGDGPGDHARAAASYLTGVHPKKTAGADIHNGISVDQVAARVIGSKTRFPSIELGCEDGRQAGNCDSGYSCAYSNNISWRNATAPMPPIINPRVVFERLFGNDDGADPATRAKRRLYNKSILDFVQEDTQQLQGKLGPTDRRKLDEYLYAVRQIEGRIDAAERQSAEAAPAIEKPTGIPLEYGDHVRLMFDLMAVALQADLTRIMTFMFGREGSNRTYSEIGVSEAHHGLTHHRGDPEKIAKISKINRFHMEQFAYFIGKLASIQDGDGTLLDHSMVLYGSGISDGNRHLHHNLPVLMVGRGGGIRPARHVRFPQETPMTNLYLTMLDRMGLHPETIGDSNGELQHLTDIT
jgi:hypothetical protein